MNRIYNVLLIILIIAAIIVGIMIFQKYYNEAKNQQELSEFVEEMEKENQDDNKYVYKGYKVIGFIEIPKIDVKYPILSETSDESLKVSVTRFNKANINEIGNFAIAGHNNLSGTMFGKNKKLQNGDIIRLTDLKKNTVEYEVFDKYSIDPNDISCVEVVKPGTREVTLLTCTNGIRKRLVIKAREK